MNSTTNKIQFIVERKNQYVGLHMLFVGSQLDYVHEEVDCTNLIVLVGR